jgi:hypothetical protein
MPVKNVTPIGFGFSLFLGLALATQSYAAENFTYRDPHGNLVILNKPTPPKSHSLRRRELPEPTGPQAQQPSKDSDTLLNRDPKGSAKPSNK